MNQTQLKRVKKMAIEKLQKKPLTELATMLFNSITLEDNPQTEIIQDAVPELLYRLPPYEYRIYFEMLEWVSVVAGLEFWKAYTLHLTNCMTDAEFYGYCLGLNDVIEHFKIDREKAKVMGNGAFYSELTEHQKVKDKHCPKRRKAVFDVNVQVAESMVS